MGLSLSPKHKREKQREAEGGRWGEGVINLPNTNVGQKRGYRLGHVQVILACDRRQEKQLCNSSWNYVSVDGAAKDSLRMSVCIF